MTIQQIADTIDKNNWAFSVYKTKPEYKVLVIHTHGVENTAQYITDLAKKSKADEIQIEPAKKNGSRYKHGFAKTITINFKKKEMENNIQLNALAGLSGLGLNMSEIFTAKDKAAEVTELKQKVERLEAENKNLESTNKDLGFDLKLEKSKSEKKNEFVELLKSPQGITLLSTIASKFSAAPALGSPAGQSTQELDKKTEWIINFLEDKETPDLVKDYIIYIIKGYQDKNGSEIIRDVTDVLIKHNIVQSNTQL